MKTLNCLVRTLWFFPILTLFSFGASAQLPGVIDANIAIDTGDSDPGVFDTIALGEDITLDGCFSRFVLDATGSSLPLCYDNGSFGTTSGSLFDWTLVNNTTSASASFSGRSVPLSTGGASDFINAAGSYTISLIITSNLGPVSELVPLSAFGNFGIQSGGAFGTETASFTVTSSGGPVTVPEPSAAFLLVPALVMIGRRQRRQQTVNAC